MGITPTRQRSKTGYGLRRIRRQADHQDWSDSFLFKGIFRYIDTCIDVIHTRIDVWQLDLHRKGIRYVYTRLHHTEFDCGRNVIKISRNVIKISQKVIKID